VKLASGGMRKLNGQGKHYPNLEEEKYLQLN
jgi:hypothetical protein